MRAEVLAVEERKLLGERPRASNVHVGSLIPRPFTEIALRSLGIRGPVLEPRPLDGAAVRLERLEGRNGHLNVDDRLGRKARDGRRPDVVDAKRHIVELTSKPRSHRRESDGPVHLVLNDYDSLRHAPSMTPVP